MKRFNIFLLLIFAISSMIIYSCKKKAEITIAPDQAHFTGQSSGSLQLDSPGRFIKIPIGILRASQSEKTVTVSITSPTGAIEGTHYTVNKKSFTFTPGQALDTLVITGVQSEYLTGRKDTLEISFVDPTPSDYNGKYILKISGPCFEGDLVLDELEGSYPNTKEYDSLGGFSYGPYDLQIINLTATSSTTATGSVVNMYDDTWNNIPINLDWTDPANLKVSIPMTQTGKSYGGSGQPTYVVSSDRGINTFSYCNQTNQTFIITIDLIESGVTILSNYQFKVKR